MLGKRPVPGSPTNKDIIEGQGPIALAVGAAVGCLFILVYTFFLPYPSLWETVRYRLKYCLKGPIDPKPIN